MKDCAWDFSVDGTAIGNFVYNSSIAYMNQIYTVILLNLIKIESYLLKIKTWADSLHIFLNGRLLTLHHRSVSLPVYVIRLSSFLCCVVFQLFDIFINVYNIFWSFSPPTNLYHPPGSVESFFFVTTNSSTSVFN